MGINDFFYRFKKSIFVLIIFTFLIEKTHAVHELCDFIVNGESWERKGKVFSKGKLSVEVTHNPLNLAANQPVARVGFLLKDANQTQLRRVEFLPPRASFLFPEEKKYDPKKNGDLKTFVGELLKKAIPGIEQVLTEDVDIDGIGTVKLVFQRARNIRFYKPNPNESWILEHDEEGAHKSFIRVPYGFEGEDATNFQEIFTMEHAEQPVDHPKIWYLDNQRWLKRVKSIEYTTIQPNLVKWAQHNNIPVHQYSKLVEGSGEAFVLYPPEEAAHPIYDLVPQADALNQFYRFESEGVFEATNYIHFKNDKGFFKSQGSVWRCSLQDVMKVGLKFTFTNQNKLANRIYTDRQSQVPIVLPQRTGSGGQVVKDKEFKQGLYRLLHTHDQPATDKIQTWVEEPQNGESVVVRLSGIRDNGSWATLETLPNIRPVSQGGKTIVDLSNHLHDFSLETFAELKNYLHTIFWVERKKPVVKYHFPVINQDQLKKANTYLNELMTEVGFFEFNLDSGSLLTHEDGPKWAVRPTSEFAKRDRSVNKRCLLCLNPRLLVDSIKKLPELRELDLTHIMLQSRPALFTLLADDNQIERVGIKEFRSPFFKEMGLTDSQIIKLVGKSKDLQTLELPNMSVTRRPEFGQSLVANARTLKHLNLSEVIGLGDHGVQFVAIVKRMINLETLNVRKADLSNSQIVTLAETLSNLTVLNEVSLTMPYYVSNLIENERRIIVQSCEAVRRHPFNIIDVLPKSLPMFVFGIPFDILFDIVLLQGKDFESVCESLAKITKLRKTTLHLKNWIKYKDWTKEEINRFRQKPDINLPMINVEFVD